MMNDVLLARRECRKWRGRWGVEVVSAFSKSMSNAFGSALPAALWGLNPNSAQSLRLPEISTSLWRSNRSQQRSNKVRLAALFSSFEIYG